MALAIPDEVLRQAGLSEHEMAIEIACRLFAAQVLSKPQASRLCALNRVQFEEELCKRDLPVVIYTADMLAEDLESLKKLNEIRAREPTQRAGRQ